MLKGKENNKKEGKKAEVRSFTLRFIKPYVGNILLFFLFTIFATIFSIASILSVSNFLQILFDSKSLLPVTNPSFIEEILDKLYSYIISYGKLNALWIFSGLIFTIYLLKDVFTYLSMYIISSTRNKIVRNIRNSMFKQYTGLSISFISHYRKGDMLSRINTDVTEYDESVLKSLQSLITNIITVVLYLVVLIYIDLRLTLLALVIFPVFATLVSFISHTLKRDSKHVQQKLGLLTSIIEETISGLKIIKSLTAIELMNKRFQQFNLSYTRLRNKIYRRVDLASPQSEFFGNCMIIGLLLFGSLRVISEPPTISAELFIVYLILFVLVIKPVKDISASFYNIRKGEGSVFRMNEILLSQNYIAEPNNTVHFPLLQEGIHLKNINFEYNSDMPVLKNINVIFEAGKTTAIVGASGSGKSTLIDLISKFYSPNSGTILFDNIDIKSLKAKDIRDNLSIVTQETILFNDTIANNISFGNNNFTRTDIIHAAQIANAEEFILNLPQQYDTIIGDSGNILSGGQRQRLSIARAVLRNTPILILDEATSALDTISEKLVQDAINKLCMNEINNTRVRTTIVIAHRLSTIIHADKIIVIDNGEIKETGNHNTLYSLGGIYRKLCDMQELK
ncbi:MAG: ABC transporter ATP-binding protein/permease [Bacteroidales bacterium]|jgi:subfamily B ATP-binding cassette protein MsbA|nr:ABC transporter ATP-binding protein/permease [Bacteroidales bacterium]